MKNGARKERLRKRLHRALEKIASNAPDNLVRDVLIMLAETALKYASPNDPQVPGIRSCLDRLVAERKADQAKGKAIRARRQKRLNPHA